MKMVKFKDNEKMTHYGIRITEGVLCGCCGSIFDIKDDEIEILDTYDGPLEDIIKEAMKK